MSDNEEGGGGESVPEFDMNEVELPPDVKKLIAEMRGGKKTLMRNAGFTKGEQLRAFIGTYLFTYLEKSVVLLTVGYLDVFNLAASLAEDVHKLRRRVRDLEDDDRGSGSGGLDDDDADELAKMNDDMLQALVGLAGILEKRLPEDKEVNQAFESCAEIAKAMATFLADDDGAGPSRPSHDDDDDADDDESKKSEQPPEEKQ